MTEKLEKDGKIQQNTGSSLDLFHHIEKSFYDKNPKAQKRNTRKSQDWFRKMIPKNYHRIQQRRLFKDKDMVVDAIRPGDMYFAVYDPIWKEKLPVYDTFPLILPWDVFKHTNGYTYVMAINLHYLPPRLRLEAYRALLTVRSQKRYRKGVKFKISWQILQALSKSKLFEHSVKMYRIDHFKSKFVKIPPKSWEMAIFLPTAQFKKGGKSTAWSGI